jgi:hypothetical protein
MSLNHMIPGLSPTKFLGTVLSDTLGERNATDQYGGQVKLWNHEGLFLSLQESSGLSSAQVETPGTNCGHKLWTFKYFVLLRISAEER